MTQPIVPLGDSQANVCEVAPPSVLVPHVSAIVKAAELAPVMPPADYYLDAPPCIRMPAGGVFSDRYWFDVLPVEMISLKTAMDISKNRGSDPFEQSFAVMAAMIVAWNVQLSDKSIAPIDEENIKKLPAQMIVPLLTHMNKVKADFLGSELQNLNQLNS